MYSQEFFNRNKIEENKNEPLIGGDGFFDEARPESTEIRIDPGGYTANNFHKSNESPFFFPEIKTNEHVFNQNIAITKDFK